MNSGTKRVLMSVIIGLIALMIFPVNASDGNSSSANGDAVLMLKQEDPLRKRMPSRNALLLYYDDGSLLLQSQIYEGEFSLFFEKCEFGECYEISSIFVGETVMLDLMEGEYNVSAKDSDGRLFFGYLVIE